MTVTASNYARKENDLYQTEPWAVEVLLRHIDVSEKAVWECAAGNHLIADVLTEHGALVTTSDICTYDREHSQVQDFLCFEWSYPLFDAIITNPPFGKQNRTAVKFMEKALSLCDGYVAMLCTAKFDFGKTRQHLFKDNPRFMMKIALLDRLSWTLDGATGTEDHAWYLWRPVDEQVRPPYIAYEGKNVLCDDCPPKGYPTDKTRCLPCPRRGT